MNKVGLVENQFRVLPMELIAGEADYDVQLKESDCLFTFDFSEVFGNSRLENEHRRIIQLCKPGEIVCKCLDAATLTSAGDMFAGIGPFAIPLAKKGVMVHANDLNPKSYEYMNKNVLANLRFGSLVGHNRNFNI